MMRDATMKSTRILVLAAATVACFVLTGCAAPKPEPRQQVNRFDRDGDGYLTREEYSASALSGVMAFDALDTDGDGLLSRRELEFQAGGGSHGSGSRGGKRSGGGQFS